MHPLLQTERTDIEVMKKENRELMEQMLMAIHAKDTLEMLVDLIENSDKTRSTGRCCWILSEKALTRSLRKNHKKELVKCLY